MSSDHPLDGPAELFETQEVTKPLRPEENDDRRACPCLVVLSGPELGRVLRVEEGDAVIGRSASCSLRVDDPGISRRHARVIRVADAVAIEDLESSNGTLVNGDRVTDRRVLEDGDKLRLGALTTLKFTYQDQLDERFQSQMLDAALRDGLTQAFNRRYLLERLEAELAHARRHRTGLGLILLDLDHFKRVNDEHGHPAGDEVLNGLTRVAWATVRTEDVFARYGGEEFAVLSRGADLESTVVLAERLRAAVEGTPFEASGQVLRVTVSCGAVSFPEAPAASPDALIAAADAALYEAKRTGRNRVAAHR
jgi:two-component system, cell cycle response regulator